MLYGPMHVLYVFRLHLSHLIITKASKSQEDESAAQTVDRRLYEILHYTSISLFGLLSNRCNINENGLIDNITLTRKMYVL